MKLFLIIASFLVSFATPVQAAIVGSATEKIAITGIYSYSDYGGGDVVFTIATVVPGCDAGFWLRPSDPGFDRNLAAVMSAHLSNRPIIVLAHDDQLWGGSTGKYCRVDMIAI
ncbi:hypothetical protein GCM10009096_00450 [Parasphingorhabdus litoris]|uniref:Uncharacterized protein n=1 Tax=Parasphingorhabdus litoris TaxID=394733 RepID=A0ABN2R4X9_9SPHN|nr:hypothetical protein [Parasphingorhabdus litoris]